MYYSVYSITIFLPILCQKTNFNGFAINILRKINFSYRKRGISVNILAFATKMGLKKETNVYVIVVYITMVTWSIINRFFFYYLWL